MQRMDFRHVTRLRVRPSEVDQRGMVFHAHYLAWYEAALSDYWRSLALPYADTMQRLGCNQRPQQADTRFHADARLDDLVEVWLRCERMENDSLVFAGVVFVGNQLINSAELVHGFADVLAQCPVPVPEALRMLITAFEAGDPMTQIRVGQWPETEAGAQAVRTAVFVQEQGFAPNEEYDQLDAVSVHALLENRLGTALATARLLPPRDGVGTIGRVAVVRDLRGSGAGRQIMLALQQAAVARGDVAVCLGAQASAIAFYRRLGYALADTPPYDEGGIAHRDMVLRL